MARQFTLAQVQAMSDAEIAALSPDDFAAAMKVAQAEGAPVAPEATRPAPLAEGTARVFLPRPGAEQ